jgi:uncharacterized protein YcbK (DUF882 family)
MDHSRRVFVKGFGLALPLFGVPKLLKAAPLHERKLNMYNIHTGEWFKETVSANGSLVSENLRLFSKFMRDWRNNSIHAVDERLVRLLVNIKSHLPEKSHFNLVCGYRCAETNRMLHKTRRGVAKNSLHCHGQAVDISCESLPLSKLRDIAKGKRAGGVGYYRKSGFIHVDVRERPFYWG